MFRFTIGVLAFCLLLSCQEEKTELVIPEDKLIPILADLHMAKMALANVVEIHKDSIENVYYSQILEIHNVADSILRLDLARLADDPEQYQKISIKVAEMTKKDKENFAKRRD